MKSPVRKLGNNLLAAGLLVGYAFSQSAAAAMVLVDVYMGNDGINMDGSTQLEALAGLTTEVNQLDRVEWDFSDADGNPLNGLQAINPQTSGDLTIEGVTFKIPDDPTEATAGNWSYTGTGMLDYITIKFDSFVALYQITDGDTSGSWDTSIFCGTPHNACGGPNGDIPFAMSHMAAYTIVPVPAAVWLFGSGLVGLVGVARRKRNKI